MAVCGFMPTLHHLSVSWKTKCVCIYYGYCALCHVRKDIDNIIDRETIQTIPSFIAKHFFEFCLKLMIYTIQCDY